MEIAAFFIGFLMYAVGVVIVGLLLLYFVINRIRERRKEDFEKRSN